MKIYLNSFASLINKRSESSLENAIGRLLEGQDAPFWYSRIRPGVRSFFVDNLNLNILNSLLVKLDQLVPETKFQRLDCENSRQVVLLMKTMDFGRFIGQTFIKPAAKSVPFYGIELEVNPDAIIMWKDAQDMFHVGAIKTKLKKSAFKKEEATMIACIIKYYLETLFPEYVVEDDYCICYDAFRSKMYSSNNYTKNLIVASALAQRIAMMTPAAA